MDPRLGYEIPYSSSAPPFKVRPSANAWWTNTFTFARFLTHLEVGDSLETACMYADISAKQYKYFLKEHPEFNLVRNHIQVQLTNRARGTVGERLYSDGAYARRYLLWNDPSAVRKRWATVPYCLRCQREITRDEIPDPYKPGFDKLNKPLEGPRTKYKVREKREPQMADPVLKKIKQLETRLARDAKEKEEQERLALEELKRPFEEFKKRHGLPEDEGYR